MRSAEGFQRKKGMPLGNLTSQFFANIYLNELDQFVKNELRIKHYIRYVDDFVILHADKSLLEEYKNKINDFLKNNLKIELHPQKCKIVPLKKGINFLGFRIFSYHRLLRRNNIRSAKRKLEHYKLCYQRGQIPYDIIYESFQGWMSYARHADTYNLCETLRKQIEEHFPNEISSVELNRLEKLI
jgi:hypothetical protein